MCQVSCQCALNINVLLFLNIYPLGFVFQIIELEAQCDEIDKERERNEELSRRLQELETEIQDKEAVSWTVIQSSMFDLDKQLELKYQGKQ